MLFLLRDLILPAVLFLLSIYLKPAGSVYYEIFAYFAALLLIIKYDGALGLALAKISIQENGAYSIARQSARSGLAFFFNALRNGEILVFGQMVMVCACFLFQSNFIFSPFLFVYENLRGKAAKQRSVDLSKNFGWVVLRRSAYFLFIGYGLIAIWIAILFSKFVLLLSLLLIPVVIYVAAIQTFFVREVYLEVLNFKSAELHPQPSMTFKLMTVFAMVALVFLYVGIRIVPNAIGAINLHK